MRLVGRQRRGVGELGIDHHINLVGNLVDLAVAGHLEMPAMRDRAEQFEPVADGVEVIGRLGGEEDDMADHR